MQATAGPKTVTRGSRTFTENARRAQIVEAAIQTIAELGFGRASFAQIAKRAGLSSTGLISYHFANKDEVITQVVTETHAALGQFVGQRVQAQTTAAGMLRAYITAVVDFIASNGVQMQALLQIFLNFRPTSAGRSNDATTGQMVVSDVERILRHGQDGGEFRQFDTLVMAVTIQRAVDGLPFLLETRSDTDLGSYARELVTLFDLATRRVQVPGT
ncbi:MAG: TetR family transcriptional regulator [Actinomycetota bacterium]|nr:TetR family transcriptional regulator [Actinomycetota bacterium]